jgi:predicted nucleic acid-binding protein
VGPTALVVDSGPLYAMLDRTDQSHERCRDLLETFPGPVLVPTLCLAEVSHLLGRARGLSGDEAVQTEIKLLGDMASGSLLLEPVEPVDLLRIAELVSRYRDLPLGTVDASVVAVAERHEVTSVATLDRRHFSVVRPRHVEAFELLP